MTYLLAIAAPALYFWLFWSVYVLVMGIYRAHLSGRMSRVTLALALPWVALGYAMDVLANMTLAVAGFMDRPQELLVTARLKRYMAGPDGWRKTVATWMCAHLLDIFDPSGRHC